ncbi:MAG: hypothetical protein BJ554DRAFT_4241, partial [Olpidium bornovanus]
MVVIITNTFIGYFQEYRAEKTMESLRNLTCPTALVVREGAQHHIPALQVVPGDIVQLKNGDVIPADLRLLEIFNLEIDEALLTGESAPVAKKTVALEMENAPVGDRINLAYSSTVVTKGRGKGVVISTGMETEIGQIAKALSHTEKIAKTVLQQRQGITSCLRFLFLFFSFGYTIFNRILLDKLAVKLLAFAILLAVIVFSVNRWDITADIALYAISLSIAVIPEGLVAVMTITMAVSVRAMAKQKAIVRKLSALEAIGQVSNICSDKVRDKGRVLVGLVQHFCSNRDFLPQTGTITQGRMVLSKLHLPGVGNFNVTGEGYNPVGEITRIVPAPRSPKQVGTAHPSGNELPLSRHEYPEQLKSLARVAALCNQAVLRKGNRLPSSTIAVDVHDDEKEIAVAPVETSEVTSKSDKAERSQEKGIEKEARDGGWTAFGDPTECAIQVFATKIGMGKPDLSEDYELVAEFPFESAIKTASVIVKHKPTGEVFVLLKGATEQVVSKCNGVDEEEILWEMECLASHGLRVLALAQRKVAEDLTDDQLHCWKREEANKDMTLLGLVGIFDPPRPQSKSAIQACARAGISVHMLTGDHPKTAAAIALSVGLISRAEAKASGSPATPAPAPIGTGLELFRSITMAAEEQPTANMVMTALEFDALTDREIDKLAHLPKVIARCAPHTKTRMVEALHRRMKVVAMTGDGVNGMDFFFAFSANFFKFDASFWKFTAANFCGFFRRGPDAPSLKAADVGIAMGLAGSDVAKQASDIVLTNDNFATITKAVFEGRRIFDNIQKFILHLMSTNVAEVILLVTGLSFMAREGDEVASIYPMSPVQILWLNMVTSSPPAMGLGFEKAEGHLQEAKPRPKSKGLFGRELLADIFVYGALMGMLTLTNWTLVLYAFGDGILQLRCAKASYDDSVTLGDDRIP